MKLTDNEIKRYARQIALSDVDVDGQLKLKLTSVMIVGAGGLGVAAAQYLAGAGIGTLILVDGDEVSLSNLHRQPAFLEKDIGQNKAVVLLKRLRELNSVINIVSIDQHLDSDNATDLIDRVDIVLDCTDNIRSRYLINDVCTMRNKPFVSASIYKDEGQIGLFNYEGSGTYRCMYPEGESRAEIPSCEELGVMGILPGILGLMQANEVLKITLKRGDLLKNIILYTSTLRNITSSIKYSRNEDRVKTLIENGLSSELKSDLILTKNQLKEIKFDEYTWVDVRNLHDQPVLKNNLVKRIPLSDIEINNSIPSSSSVICFCTSGTQSLIAAELLKKKGINKVLAFTGSITELQAYKFFNGNYGG